MSQCRPLSGDNSIEGSVTMKAQWEHPELWSENLFSTLVTF